MTCFRSWRSTMRVTWCACATPPTSWRNYRQKASECWWVHALLTTRSSSIYTSFQHHLSSYIHCRLVVTRCRALDKGIDWNRFNVVCVLWFMMLFARTVCNGWCLSCSVDNIVNNTLINDVPIIMLGQVVLLPDPTKVFHLSVSSFTTIYDTRRDDRLSQYYVRHWSDMRRFGIHVIWVASCDMCGLVSWLAHCPELFVIFWFGARWISTHFIQPWWYGNPGQHNYTCLMLKRQECSRGGCSLNFFLTSRYVLYMYTQLLYIMIYSGVQSNL